MKCSTCAGPAGSYSSWSASRVERKSMTGVSPPLCIRPKGKRSGCSPGAFVVPLYRLASGRGPPHPAAAANRPFRHRHSGRPVFGLGCLRWPGAPSYNLTPPGTKALQPEKKPRGRELYPWQKAINQVISRYRVVVEHAIAGVKRCRIVADTFRNWREGLVDQVMLAASGLHNLRVLTRLPA